MFGGTGMPTLLLALGPIMFFFLRYVVPATRPKKLKGSSRPHNPQISKVALLRATQKLQDIPSQDDIIAFLYLKVPTTEADLETVKAFLCAAEAMKEVPEYKNRMRKRLERKHCVRCHGEYTEATNVEKACKIPHAVSDEMTFGGKMASFDQKVYTHEALCCKGVDLDTVDGDTYVNLKEVGFCFEGKHTTQEITVELGGGPGYNDLNVVPCNVDLDTGKCTAPVVSENPIVFTS